jgi:TonB family protein
MALRALLFSKSPETAESLTAVLQEAGIHAEVCTDIFAAMEKGTKQPFASVMVDWSEQPEAGFLLKRARESGLNRTATAIAIVDGEPTPDEEREHRLDFLIYRPIVADEARAVLAKARQQMQLHSTAGPADAAGVLDRPAIAEPSEPQSEDPDLVSIASDLPETLPPVTTQYQNDETVFVDPAERRYSSSPSTLRVALAAVLVLAAALCSWKARDAFRYLSQTPEGTMHVLKDAVATFFYVNKSGSQSLTTAGSDAQQDAYFARTAVNTTSQTSTVGVVSADIRIPDAPLRLRPAYDFPLPSPELHVDPVSVRPQRAALPDSIRASAPVARPVVVTVSPAQIMPVSTPPPATSWQNTGEPVKLTEDSARALVTQSVNPVYPQEAMAQKLQGPVVLQVAIGRDGSVQDLKLVRGYFVLGRAAIAAVKQWRFKPYNVNGRNLETQTVITINFSYPPG